MGLHLSTYVIMGIKKTRQEWEDCGIDYGYIEEENPGLAAVQGEGSDDVIVGKILAKTDEYREQSATHLIIPSAMDLSDELEDAGIENDWNEVKLYFYGVYG